ncbi:hypothetical protein [Leuconostoc lactis]|uniref:hypothetical protein n=1 Tax=Leuconostoc lactis TaxID=1246 RepID=UPI00289F2ED3|nr:hypothetical protein [Leuconostoc lactis]
MAFDEAIKRLSQDIDKNGGQEKYQKEVIATLKSLQKEYAPTVEMTSGNKATFIQEGDSLSKLLTGYYGFDVLYWGDVSERKVAQAWLHPENIKVVDE